MNRYNRFAVGVTLGVTTFGMGDAMVQAQGSGDINANNIAEMSDPVRDEAVKDGTIICNIGTDVLTMYGVSVAEATVVSKVQKRLDELGYDRGGLDSVLGKYTCMEILEFQDDRNLGIDGIVGKQTATALGLTGETKPSESVETNYTIDDCSRYDDWSEATIKQVQKALGVGVDGKFGTESCNAMIEFQKANGLAQFGQGALGYKTMTALGILFPEKKPAGSSSGVFNPEIDCPTSSSCEIFEDLTAQKGYVRVNDWNNNTATGKTLFTFPIQSGKPGKETDTGLFRLGPVEYGPNGSPWRFSTLGSTNGEPNLYNFRRLNPVSGGWSGEGIHGSKSFGYGAGSSGCSRVRQKDADVLKYLRSYTYVLIQGIKPTVKNS